MSDTSTSKTGGSVRPTAHETVRDWLGIRYFNGEGDGGGAAPGAGNDPTGTAGGDAGGQPTGKSDPTPSQSSGQPSNGGGSGGQGGSGDGDRKFTQADIDKAVQDRVNREKKKQGDTAEQIAAAQRETQQAKDAQQRLLDVIAEATGQKKSDQPPDPAALQQTLTQRENRVSELESQVAERDVLLTAWAAAWDHGADPKRLMDSVSFRGELGQLDRKADGLGTRISDLVKTKVEADESLKAPTAPRTPRPDPSQGSGRPAPTGAERGVAEAQRRFGNQQQAAGKST